MNRQILLALIFSILVTPAYAANNSKSPWGYAKEIEQEYSKQKVVYDASVNTVEAMTSILNRASYLSALNGADPFENKISIVLHGNEIPFFAIKNYDKYKAMMDRAQSLTVGGIIEFKMCKIAAKGQGFDAKDIQGFVSMVPMGDAEIIKLQLDGYAYMR